VWFTMRRPQFDRYIPYPDPRTTCTREIRYHTSFSGVDIDGMLELLSSWDTQPWPGGLVSSARDLGQGRAQAGFPAPRAHQRDPSLAGDRIGAGSRVERNEMGGVSA
jgi:hypothetical protein